MTKAHWARSLWVLSAVLVLGAVAFSLSSGADRAGEKWIRRYNGPGKGADFGNAIAVDASGNIYVTGESPGKGTYRDFATVKYNSAGKQIWARAYQGTGKGDDSALAIAVDAAANVYVTGSSAGKNTGCDMATIKYNKSGKQLWVSRYNGPVDGDDIGRAIAVDASGNVYVTGESRGNGSYRDIATIKYDKLGQEIWVKRYNGPANGDDAPAAIAIDKAGNVFVTGYTKVSGTNYDYIVIKY
jgi:outer membrane protein assembly factor BamB